MQLDETGIPGCVAVRPRVFRDLRGAFVKTFHEPSFEAAGLRTDWREGIYSVSARGVIRGMHFQLPPADHAKLVYCVSGRVVDVIVDLRRGSPTYGEHRCVELDSEQGTGVYVPSGCAHGFVALSEGATVRYDVTSVHSPEHDAGIAWDSFGFDWPIADPILSDRDRQQPRLDQFDSPFRFFPAAPTR